MIMQSVSSSNLALVGYENKTLRIEFHSGGIYDYYNVLESVYLDLMNASSKGEYHAQFIKYNYEYAKIR